MAKKITIGEKRREFRGQHSSVSIKAQPIEHTFDEQELAEPVAEAIRDYIRRSIEATSVRAARTTIERRRERGVSSTKLFNDTGKLVRGLRITKDGSGFRIEAPPGRLQDQQEWMLKRLGEVVDLSPDAILRDKGVAKAMRDSVGQIVKVRR